MKPELYISKPKVDHWYKQSTIKNRPRRLLQTEMKQEFFPLIRQPLALHPLVMDRGEQAVSRILIQTSYRYLHDIAVIETEAVNQVALNIAAGRLLPIDMNTIQIAHSIMIDESYHAYIALDAIQQIENHTGVLPILHHHLNPITRALNGFQVTTSDPKYQMLQFIAVSLSEHVLTQDLVQINREDDSQQQSFFAQIMADHLLDEGMHASFFAHLLTFYYANQDAETQELIQSFIPVFMQTYIDTEFQQIFDRELLAQIGVTNHEAEEILADTYFAQNFTNNPAIKAFKQVLIKTGILQEGTLLHKYLNPSILE